MRWLVALSFVAAIAACEDSPRTGGGGAPVASGMPSAAPSASVPMPNAAPSAGGVVTSAVPAGSGVFPNAGPSASSMAPRGALAQPASLASGSAPVASAPGPTASVGDVQRALGAKQNKEALAAARSLGLSAAAAKLGAEELLTLASEARAQQASREASVLLRGLRDRFPGTDQSAMASFDLGRIAEDIDGKPVQAAVHFEQYIKEQPQGPLLREALGRAMESQERAGNLDAARAHATQYLERFPQGPHAKTARKLTAPPGVLK